MPDPSWPTGAMAWGYPEQPPEDDEPSRPWLRIVAALVATGLVAGAIGGFVGYRAAEQDARPATASLHDENATLGVPISGTAVSRPPTSVAAIAARVLRSVVSIDVAGPSGRGTGSGVVLRSDGYIL
ncbi:MAG: peptidase and chymotrypsin/Hap, partial [Frankiales bacterium]|nr:peptidase and chymotrypsin/Hap [Frankiales bacterium]